MQDLETPAVFTTVDPTGNPNSIYVILVKSDNRETVLISDGAMYKTRENIMSGSRGVFVFITKQYKAYQLKGTIKYHTSGPLFEYNPANETPEHPRYGMVELIVDEAYAGSIKLL